MIFMDFKDLKLSALGFGCMRFPLNSEDDGDIDEAKTAEMIDYAIKNGINYFDTAYPYHAGRSEIVIGKLLKKYPRDSFYLATKFPGFNDDFMGRVEEIFNEQLAKCQVEYFDFYLLHNLREHTIDGYFNEEFGIIPYLLEQKKQGRIRHLGFSSHADLATIKRFLDTWGNEMEFCQIQLNYLDWKLQNARAKVELLNQYNIPVWVMEPVRGGRLVELPEEDINKLNDLRPGVSSVEWAFRFLQSMDCVTMTLSGMSNMEQLTQNIATYSAEAPLNEQERITLLQIADDMIQRNAVPCTGCNYCVEHCPQGLNIPHIIKLYNKRQSATAQRPESPGPGDCLSCGLCKTECPQNINIPEIMADYAKHLK